MTPERLQQIHTLFEAASSHAPDEREAWLANKCGGDADLYRAVDELLHTQLSATTYYSQNVPGVNDPAPDQAGPTSRAKVIADRFKLIGFLGRGGMGQVHKATDLKLKRTVAVKLLAGSARHSASYNIRLEREALAISRLNHPHICILYDIVQDDGLTALVMEYLEGQTLSQRMKQGAIPPAEALEYASQIAEALDEAHKHGIIHRDLKPSNVMITASGVKLLDFGLAKLQETPLDPQSIELHTLTAEGAVIGTVAYMAPEQARGKAVDARSDIFAFGAVLYEMLSGEPAFRGTSEAAILAAVLMSAPPPISGNTIISPRLKELCFKCLEKDPSQRFPDVASLRAALLDAAKTVPQRDGGKSWRAYRWPMVLAACVGLLIAAVIFSRSTDSARKSYSSVAVLPLANLSGNPDQAFFAEGLTDSLIAELASIQALRVPSRTSVMAYEGVKKTLPQIGRELGAEAIVEGSVLRAGNRVRISVQLIDTASDRRLWAKSYDRQVQDVIGLQAEIAKAIASEVRARFTPEEERKLAQTGSVPAKKVDAYLQRRVSWPRGYALVIGLNDLKNLQERYSLRYAEGDAKAIYSILTSPKGGNFRKEDVHLLLGSAATLANIRRELEEWLPEAAKPEDRVLIYFAGQGFVYRGKGYLGAYDFDRDNVAATSYPMDSLGRIIGSRIQAKSTVLLTDASHTGAITPMEMSGRVMQDIGRSIFLLTSSQDRQLSFEVTEQGHGLFTYAVVKGMEGEADENHDGVVTAGELAEYVRHSVSTITGGKQTPTSDRGSYDPELPVAITSASIGSGPVTAQ